MANLGDQRIRDLGDAWQHTIGNDPDARPTAQLLQALSLRDERGRAARAGPLPYYGLHYAVHGLEGRGMVFRAALLLRRGAAIGPRAPSPLHQDVAART